MRMPLPRTAFNRLVTRLAGWVTLAACACGGAQAAAPSGLDAPLFYQILIGELELQSGQAGTAYQVMLEAARRTRDDDLFRRAVDIALSARSGEQALSAARAWRQAAPTSLDAHRYVVQLMVTLERFNDVVEPLRSLIALPPDSERAARIASVPRLFGRASDKRQAATIVEQVLRPWLDTPGEGTAAHTAVARAWLAAGDDARATSGVKRAHETDPSAEGPALLALEMLTKTPAVENVVAGYLATPQARAPIRLVYARALTEMQRHADAVVQLEAATRTDPKMAPAWLSLGALHVELRHPAEAEAALTRYLELAKDSATGEADESAELGTTQARLLLAQLAEQRQDFRAAENWLAQIDSPQRALDVQVRRASLLAKQGRLDQARELVRSAPERTGDDARAKWLAEAQLLRDQKLWAQAHDVLAQANLRFPDDVDLLYEQAMVAEKLDRLDQMETLLRRVMTIKPTHQHAYNALGYSLADRNLRLPEARELIKKALELAPGDPFITDSLGWVEFRMGNRDEALRLLREAYRARPDAEIGAHLGEVLWVSGQRNEALRIWREARTRDATNEVLRETLQRLRVEL